ncbi:MAG TPA: polyprenyl diphosphate synthase [Gammaproteobacteria bacterium]|nr:polyprenyl diphosphate synthase [Gammaproteobacteria bacterium]
MLRFMTRVSEIPVPDTDSRPPRHVAIVMDGNGRWARERKLPRFAGHSAGVDTVKGVVRACVEKGIEVLTLFAFSSENWRRPRDEVSMLMGLFMSALDQQVKKLHDNDIRLRVIGDRSAFNPGLQKRIRDAEALTRDNSKLVLVIAANYGGRWDIIEATRALARTVAAGALEPEDISEELLAHHMSLKDLPEPDLFIRTGGEQRVSNFLLWDMAYTELYFTETLWPDFDRAAFDQALASYARRQRRFGRTSEQVAAARDQSADGAPGSGESGRATLHRVR